MHPRLVFRRLARSRAFFGLAVVTLGLGLAVNLVVFAFFRATVLQPLRVPQPDRLVRVWSANPDGAVSRPAISWPFYQRIAQASDIFASAAASLPTGFTVAQDGLPLSVGGVRMTANLPVVLGLKPILGRTFTAEEDQAGGRAVAMVAEGFWRSHFGGRKDVVGLTLPIDGVPHEVVGVLPAAFSRLFAGDAIYVPRPFELPNAPREIIERGMVPYQVTARLRPGIDTAAADSALQVLGATYRRDLPDRADINRVASVRILADEIARDVRPVFLTLLGIAVCSLAIACGSFGNLVLMRLLTRSRELAVRLSLGASAAQLRWGLATEICAIVAIASVLGLGLSAGALPVVNHFAAPYLPRLPTAELDLPVVGSTLVLAALIAAGLALLPAWHLRRLNISDALRARAGTAPATTRVRQVLVGAQIAMSLALLAMATLLGASLRHLLRVPAGFTPDGAATAFVNLSRARYPSPESRQQFYQQTLERLRHAPGITDAAVVSIAPLARIVPAGTFAIAGRPQPPAERPTAVVRVVSNGYFATMRTPVLHGRSFSAAEPRPFCVINATLAKRIFPTQSPLGQTLLLGQNDETAVEIVGVVADAHSNGLARNATDEIYLPMSAGTAGSQMAFIARTDGAVETIHATLRSVVAAVDPQQSVAVFQTFASLVATSIWPQRIATIVAGTFAAASAGFALLGVFGLMSFWVGQRTPEWGLRAALGATPLVLLTHVLRAAGVVIAAGITTGLVLTLLASGTLRALLVGVDPFSPLLLGVTAATFGLVALAACVLPACRAARVDPAVALRSE